MNPIIFLDIDGVLVNDYSLDHWIKEDRAVSFDHNCVELYNKLVQKTGADTVISSTWRKGKSLERLKSIFKRRGCKYPEKIIDVTVNAHSYMKDHDLSIPRGVEIHHWIKQRVYYNNELTGEIKADWNYVILDDDSDMLLAQKDNFVKTDPRKGLQQDTYEQALEILKKDK